MHAVHRRAGKDIGAELRAKSRGFRDQKFISDLISAYRDTSTPLRYPTRLVTGRDYGQLVKYRHHTNQGNDGGQSFTEGVQKSVQKIGDDYDLDDIDTSSSSSSSSSSSTLPLDRLKRLAYIKYAEPRNLSEQLDRYFDLEDRVIRRNDNRKFVISSDAAATQQRDTEAVERQKTVVDALIRNVIGAVNAVCDPGVFTLYCNYVTKRMSHRREYLEAIWDRTNYEMRENDDVNYIESLFSHHGHVIIDSMVISSARRRTALRAFLLCYPVKKISIADYDEHAALFVEYACLISPTLRKLKMSLKIFGGNYRQNQENYQQLVDAEAPEIEKRHDDLYAFTTRLSLAVAASHKVNRLSFDYQSRHSFTFLAEGQSLFDVRLFSRPISQKAEPKFRCITSLSCVYVHDPEFLPIRFDEKFFQYCESWQIRHLKTNSRLDHLFDKNILGGLKHLKELRGVCKFINENFTTWIYRSRIFVLVLKDVDTDEYTRERIMEPKSTGVAFLLLMLPATMRILEIIFETDANDPNEKSPTPLVLNLKNRLEYLSIRKFVRPMEGEYMLQTYANDLSARVLSGASSRIATPGSLLMTLLNNLGDYGRLPRPQVRFATDRFLESDDISSQIIPTRRYRR